MRFLSLIVFFSFSICLSAQMEDPVTWSFDSNQTGPEEFELIYRATFSEPWKVYSQFTSDEGPRPTEITYESGNVEKIGDGQELGHKKEGYDKLFDTDVISFLADKPFIIKHKVKITDLSKPVKGYLTYMTCDDEKCLPPADVDFSFKFNFKEPIKVQKGEYDIKVPDEVKKQLDKAHVKEQLKDDLNQNKKTSTKAATQNTEVIKIDPVAINPGNKTVQKITIGGGAIDNDTESEEDNRGMKNPIKWDFDISKKGDEYILEFIAKIEDGWKTYSQFSNEEGPVPTYITFDNEENFTKVGKALENGKRKQGPDPLFDNVEVISYSSEQPFTIRQKVASTNNKTITGYLTYMACDHKGCLPPSDVDFVFNLKKMKAGHKSAFATTNANKNIGMNLDGNKLDQKIPSLVSSYAEPIGDCGTQIKDANASYWKIFIGGFLGGLVAILLPCIFPMIPITVSFFTKDNKRKGWVNGLVYGLSIVGIFVILGLAITALLGPTALNELSTNWVANVIFFLIFIAFAISFFGYYEITLPSSWSTRTDEMADKGGFLGTFFMAATLAIVSFSCTGPIIGSALVQVASDALGPFFIMLGFSIALAIPFGLFAAFPSWLNSLPKSGSWMNSVKVVLGFLELALALKFLSVADMTSGWGILKYELFMGLWVLIFAAMTAYLFGLFKFPHDSPVKKLSMGRKLFAIFSLGWTIYMASGFIVDKDINSYKIPKLVSGITPPASYNFFLKANELDPEIKKKYPSYTKCANDINCFKDYYDAMAYANEVNKPVLLDFTGYGCVNCRKTEDYIWKDPEIKAALNNEFVLASLYVDDRKKLLKTLKSSSRDVSLRNVGNKWADFQIVNFKQNSQPLYVPVTTDQQVITLPRGYEEGVENYKQFLDCALDINSNQ